MLKSFHVFVLIYLVPVVLVTCLAVEAFHGESLVQGRNILPGARLLLSFRPRRSESNTTITNKLQQRQNGNEKTSSGDPQGKYNATGEAEVKSENNSAVNSTLNNFVGKLSRVNSGAVLRGFYVFVGLSVIVVAYFVVRAVRLRRRRTKVRKYGIVANREDLEMTPLGADEEEDDNTVFDLSNHSSRP